MQKLLKLNPKNTFFTSDWHANHNQEFVWGKRGFNSREHHTQGIISRVNDLVGDADVIVNLGDLTLNCSEEEFEFLLDSINCKRMYCLWGNHPNPMRRIYKREVKRQYGDEGVEVYPLYYKNLIYVGDYLDMQVGHQMIKASHFPMFTWENMMHGSWCLCGHEHGGVEALNAGATKGKILDVGWDEHRGPLSFEQVKQIMLNKETVKIGHHQ